MVAVLVVDKKIEMEINGMREEERDGPKRYS